MLRKNRLLLFIILLAFLLRFYKLGSNPPSMNWDETAHGFNAYSILKTGSDEFGYFMPLSFRSFDDYKPPIYTYLVVPSVAAFGLNNFAVRLPSAVLGILAVLFTYLMVYQLFKNKPLALLSALFLAISPWHLQFSRVAFETNSATFWSVLGTWAFLKGLDNTKRKFTLFISLSALAFGANLFMYHNSRVFIPLYTSILIFLFRKQLLKNVKNLLIPAVIAVFFVVLLLPIIFSISGQLRFKGTSIFADTRPLIEKADLIAQDEKDGKLLLGQILHNRRFAYVPIVFFNYLSHLNPQFLFINADLERHHAPLMGLLYIWDLPFLVAGMYFLAKGVFKKSAKIIIFWWFLIAPVASSVTWGVPHSLRSEIFLPTFQIFTAIGVYTFYKYVRYKRAYIIVASTLLALNFLFYIHQYYVHLPVVFSKPWLWGRSQAVQITEGLKDKYDRVIVSTRLEQPHMFWLYYTKYDPKKYLAEGGTVSGGFLEDRNHFDKYLFKPIDYENQKGKTLFVGTQDDFPPGVKIIQKIYYLDGEDAIYIAE